jgi:hypothetical protein
MSLTFVPWRLVVLVCLAFPLSGHAQGLTSDASGDNPFATGPSASSPGFSSARSFRPYGEKTQNRVPAMQPAFAQASGFNWAQFFRSAAETGTRLAAPKLFANDGRSELSGGSLFHAGSVGTSGDSFDLSSRGMNFSTKSSGLDLHLSLQSMFPNGFSPRVAGSSFAGSGWSSSGEGGLGSPGAMGTLGGRDAQRGSGARVSLQLKF